MGLVKQRYRTLTDYFTQTGETRASLARELGVSKGFVAMLAKGERFASPEMALRIAELTGVAPLSLLDPRTVALLKVGA